jgi:hypothetical protein
MGQGAWGKGQLDCRTTGLQDNRTGETMKRGNGETGKRRSGGKRQRIVKGKDSGQGTGKMAKRRHGETGRRRNFTPLRITIYALRITNPASRLVASSEWRIVFWRAVFLHCRKISAHQEMRPPVKIHFTSRQSPVAAIYALRHKFVRGLRPSYQLFANRHSLIAAVL